MPGAWWRRPCNSIRLLRLWVRSIAAFSTACAIFGERSPNAAKFSIASRRTLLRITTWPSVWDGSGGSEADRSLTNSGLMAGVIEADRAWLSARAGDRRPALAVLESRRDLVRRGKVDATSKLLLAAVLDRMDEAYEALEVGLTARAPELLMLSTEPGLDPIRKDPRYPGCCNGSVLRHLARRRPEPEENANFRALTSVCRDMANFSGELRHVLRRFARTPAFTGVTLLTLAIGIGANTAIFSVVNGVLLKPLPYPDSDRLVAIWQTVQGLGIPRSTPLPPPTSSIAKRAAPLRTSAYGAPNPLRSPDLPSRSGFPP